jgi:heme/copper-type cytochrome/quinol oxidase subunit 2
LTLIDIITGLIDFRTFSNIWYWLAVMVTWAVATHWVIGVPFDMVVRARRQGGQAAQDLDILVAINLRRLLTLSGTPAVILVGIGAFVVTAAAMLGFVYGLELAQGLFCLAFPLVFVAVLTWRSCQRLALDQQTGPALIRALVRLRFWIQLIAITALFCTALLGIYVMLSQRFG